MLPFTDTRPATPNDRPVLVTSHSFGFSRREWTEVADILDDQYRLVAIDMPGFGAAHALAGYTMEEMARAFAGVIHELGLTRYVLIGHSMSGKIAQILASRAGKDLGLTVAPEKLVLITPTRSDRKWATTRSATTCSPRRKPAKTPTSSSAPTAVSR